MKSMCAIFLIAFCGIGVAAEGAGARNCDPARNTDDDIQAAQVEARRSGKRILLDVGGEWCPWCRLLDAFFRENPALFRLRERNFVTVPVCFSPDNRNERALERYPAVGGVPHFFVLDANGNLLQSQRVVELQQDGGYNEARIREFLMKWAPAKEEK